MLDADKSSTGRGCNGGGLIRERKIIPFTYAFAVLSKQITFLAVSSVPMESNYLLPLVRDSFALFSSPALSTGRFPPVSRSSTRPAGRVISLHLLPPRRETRYSPVCVHVNKSAAGNWNGHYLKL